MFFIAVLLGFFAQAETYSIHRLEPQHNLAVIATVDAQNFSVGHEFSVETPQGVCHLVVQKIVTDYIYVDTEQCQTEYLSRGTPISPRQKVAVEKPQPQFVNAQMSTDSVSTDLNFLNSDFYSAFVQNRLSATVSYLSGNTLDGQAQINPNLALGDIRGSNTMAVGFDYALLKLPYRLSWSAGMAYSLPRSYGRFQVFNNGASQTVNFNETPKLETLSLFSNIRYHWNEQTLTYFGINRLFVDSSGFNGEMGGDFGFHIGGRRTIFENFFADASLNFYNVDYEIGGQTFDYSLSELELKAGYTF